MSHATAAGKICDAADWSDPDVEDVIRTELKETPGFHRKQWEFAMIFLALRERGFLRGDAVGLSLGGGYERVLYAVGRHVRELVVTDLYAPDSAWETSSTGDPQEFLLRHQPFPVEEGRLRALRMDMRFLDFPDESFDFCYSSCAIEHIGGRDDFLRHMNEVARVLKSGGVYVLTTEVSLEDEVIENPGNYVFTLPYLAGLIADSELRPEGEFDARIAAHGANQPLPGNLQNLVFRRPGGFFGNPATEAPHLHLLHGKQMFTSGLLVLRRRLDAPGAPLRTIGAEASRAFLAAGVRETQCLLESTAVDLDPFAWLPRRTGNDETFFHTDYSWWGSGPRVFNVAMEVAGGAGAAGGEIELRLHRLRTLAPAEIECVTHSRHVLAPGRHSLSLRADVHEDWCYAVLARRVDGAPRLTHVGVSSLPAGAAKEGEG